MTTNGLTTTVQESKGKFTTPIPMAFVKLLGIDKGDKFMWNFDKEKIVIEVLKE